MVDYTLKDLFYRQNVDKQFIITTDDGTVTITNTELHQESFELTESLCSESELTFGACEAAAVKFTMSNVFTSLKDKWITVKIILDGNSDNPFILGHYKVISDKPTADRIKREIEAYDALYDVINADVIDWYNEILPSIESTVTLKAFRDSFFAHFGIVQKENTLVNDTTTVNKAVDADTLSGSQVLNAICEINGCLGHIGRSGQFEYVYLDSTTPTTISKNHYISADYQDYIVAQIDKLQIRQDEDDIGAIVGTGSNTYVIENNFLVYGKDAVTLKTIATNIFDKIKGITYRPAEITSPGNPCIEVGDAIKLSSKYAEINTYVLERTLKGIQALTDSFTSQGEQLRNKKVNGISASIQQLRERSNSLMRTVDETRSTLRATMVTWDTGTYSVEYKGYGEPTYDTIDAPVGSHYLDISTGYIYYQGEEWYVVYECSPSSEILESQIIQTAKEVSSKVSKGNVISEINQTAEKVKIKADKIELDGMVVANATLTAPKILGKETHAEAISIGKDDRYNNVVANSEGVWLIGDGTAEKPAVRLENSGKITIKPYGTRTDKFISVIDAKGDEYGITGEGKAVFSSYLADTVEADIINATTSLKIGQESGIASVFSSNYAKAICTVNGVTQSKHFYSFNESDGMPTIDLRCTKLSVESKASVNELELIKGTDQFKIYPDSTSNYHTLLFREYTNAKIYTNYCSIDKFKAIFGKRETKNGTTGASNYTMISNTTGAVTVYKDDKEYASISPTDGIAVKISNGGSVKFTDKGIQYKKYTISTATVITWDTFMSKLGG